MQKIASRMYFIPPNQVPVFPYSNSLWIDDNYPTIIDFGAGIQAYSNIDQEKVAYGLFSHAHFDHMHCNTLFTKAVFMASELEVPIYQQESSYEENFGYDFWEKIMPEYQSRPPFGAIRTVDTKNVPVKPGFRYIKIGETLYDNKIINTGHINIRAVHLPGHSVGHFGFYFELENILFSGDLDLVASGPLYNNSTSDVGSLISSINKIEEINPRMIISSHRRIQEDDLKYKLQRYKKVVTDRNEYLYDYLATPRNIAVLYELTFREIHDIYDIFWNRMTINNHIKYLLQEKIIMALKDNYYVRK